MNLIEVNSILQADTQALKQTSKTLFTQFESNQPSDIKSISCQNSDIKIESQAESQKSEVQEMNVYELLNRCDQFIHQHSNQLRSVKKSSVNSLDSSFQASISKECFECKYHLLKELEWMKEKIRLQQKIQQLKKNLKEITQITELQNQGQIQKQHLNQAQKRTTVLKVQSQVFSLEIKDYEEYGFLSQSPSPQSTSGIRSDSQQEITSQNELLLESIKNVNGKLMSSETENKYLKIENRSLLKTKSQIQTMKKQIQKTKSQRDLFKKKLITLAEKQSQSKQKHQNTTNEKTSNAGLKERGLQAKKKNETLFQLSLTDASSIRQSHNSQNATVKLFKKPQRVNFTCSFKPI